MKQYGVRSWHENGASWHPRQFFDTPEEAETALERMKGSYKTGYRQFEIIEREVTDRMLVNRASATRSDQKRRTAEDVVILCEVNDCDSPAHECVCGAAHCANHPHDDMTDS